jgi:AcrR family transcriptional regulator
LAQTSQPRPVRGRPPSTSPEAVYLVAQQLFLEQGYDETTIEEIADALGVTSRTVFRYFGSKEDILWFGAQGRQVRLKQALKDAQDDDAPMFDVIHRSIMSAYGDYLSDPRIRPQVRLVLSVSSAVRHKQLELWSDAVARYAARRMGLRRTDFAPMLVAEVTFAVAIAAARKFVQSKTKASFADYIAEGFEMLSFDGADAPAGSARKR